MPSKAKGLLRAPAEEHINEHDKVVVVRRAVATGGGLTDAPIEQVFEALKAKVGDKSLGVGEVLIRPATGVPWGAVVRTHELCTKAGFVRVGPKTGN